MKTVNIPLSAILGPSREMVESLLLVVVDSVAKYSDVFEYSVEDALTKIHDEIDHGIDVLSGAYSDIKNVEYIMVFQGTNTCDFMPCNDFTQDVVDIMTIILDEQGK